MKFLLALAFLTVVCAIPRPRHISAPSHGLQQLAPTQDPVQENNQAGKVSSRPEQLSELENSDESDFTDRDDDKDDSSEKLSLQDLINALNSIREAIKNKIHDKLGHNEDSENDNKVPSERVPVKEDSTNETADDGLQQSNIASEEHQHNTRVSNTKGNETASDEKPKINLTLISKKIHEKIDNIIANILRPWLGNNSLQDEGVEEIGSSSVHQEDRNRNNTANSTEIKPPNVGALNETESEQVKGDPQEANNSVLSPNDSDSNGIEGDDESSIE